MHKNYKNSISHLKNTHAGYKHFQNNTLATHSTIFEYKVPLDSALPDRFWSILIFYYNEVEDAKVIKPGVKEFFTIGRDAKLCDWVFNNEIVSRKHAVLQFRKTNSILVKPFIIDLNSTFGTYINGERIQPCRFYEILDQDILQFGTDQKCYWVFLEQKP